MAQSESKLAERAVALKASNPTWGYIRIGREIRWHKDKVRRAIEHAERKSVGMLAKPQAQALSHYRKSVGMLAKPQAQALSHYDAARHALAIAKSLDEVMEIADKATAIKEYARRAKDRQLQIDATEIVIRAERRLGEMLHDIKTTTGFARGGRPAQDVFTGSDLEPVASPPTLEQIGVDKKLSMRAQKLAAVPEKQIEDRISEWRQNVSDGDERISLNILKDTTTEGKKQARTTREADLGAKQQALPTRKYGVILADPEWRFEPWSRETGMDRAADNHYPTSCTEVIASRDVASIAAEDCVLFLWATVPMLPHALTVMAAWGFDYRSHIVWDKIRSSGIRSFGMGYWFRNCHELLLVGVRGNVPAPAPGTQEQSILEGIVGKHSEKPECFLEIIERYFPTLPKIELNRRGPRRPGWDAWGNEARGCVGE